MQRSKQQALMFLLGAVFVGGILGFSADLVLDAKPKNWAPRMRMYDDLALTEAQRSTMDSLLDERTCQISAVMKPVRPVIDSVKQAARQQMLAILTPDQRQKLEVREQEFARRDSVRAAARPSKACK